MSVSVLGYEMKPFWYKLLAASMTLSDDMRREVLPFFWSSIVVSGSGRLGISHRQKQTYHLLVGWETYEVTVARGACMHFSYRRRQII